MLNELLRKHSALAHLFFFFPQMMGGEKICRGNTVFCFVCFLAVLGLHYCVAFSLVAVYGLLITVASLVVEHGL